MGVLAHVVPKTPPRKMCQKPHPEKNRFKPEKSQGQIFQECQGQKFPKVKWETTKKRKKPVLTGKNRKNGKWKKWESVTKM